MAIVPFSKKGLLTFSGLPAHESDIPATIMLTQQFHINEQQFINEKTMMVHNYMVIDLTAVPVTGFTFFR